MILVIDQRRLIETFPADAAISELAVVCITGLRGAAGRSVTEAYTSNQAQVIGVNLGAVASGKLAKVVTFGLVSGVVCGGAVNAGDRLMAADLVSGPGLASGPGLVQSLNSVTPQGANAAPTISFISGQGVSGIAGTTIYASGSGGALLFGGGVISGVTGVQAPAFSGTSVNIGRVIGRALMSGGLGSAIAMMVVNGG